jgi:hypothetical protein
MGAGTLWGLVLLVLQLLTLCGFERRPYGFGDAVRIPGSGRASQLPWLIRLARADGRESLTVFGLGQVALVHVAAAVMLQGNLVIFQIPAQL